MGSDPQPITYRTDWHWGPLVFDGLLGLHGTFLCFHRHPAADDPVALVDPAKPVLALEPDPAHPVPDFVLEGDEVN
jgi:hypothetical protein